MDKFATRQFRAPKGSFTMHALTEIHHTWHRASDKHNSWRTVFIDYLKAFQSHQVYHNSQINGYSCVQSFFIELDAFLLLHFLSSSGSTSRIAFG
jgi:hypothetical protein